MFVVLILILAITESRVTSHPPLDWSEGVGTKNHRSVLGRFRNTHVKFDHSCWRGGDTEIRTGVGERLKVPTSVCLRGGSNKDCS